VVHSDFVGRGLESIDYSDDDKCTFANYQLMTRKNIYSSSPFPAVLQLKLAAYTWCAILTALIRTGLHLHMLTVASVNFESVESLFAAIFGSSIYCWRIYRCRELIRSLELTIIR